MPSIPRLLLRLLPICVSAVALAGAAFSQGDDHLRTGHSVPGFYGLESSVLPAWGLSYQTTGVYYTAQKEMNRHGSDTGIHGHLHHAAAFATMTWHSPWKILGGEYVARLRTSLSANAQHPRGLNAGSDRFDLGDVYVEPLALYWTSKNGILSMRYGWWLDTGPFSPDDANSIGKGFKSQVATLGGTYYPGPERFWNYSILARFSTHSKVSGIDVRPGDDLVVDWSLAKHITPRWNVGLAGYGVFQTRKDRGADSAEALGYYGKAAAGFAARYTAPEYGGNAFARFYQEFNSFNHTEGTMLVLGLNFKL